MSNVINFPNTMRSGAYSQLVAAADQIDGQSGTEYALACLEQQAFRLLHNRRGEVTSRMEEYQSTLSRLRKLYGVDGCETISRPGQ